MEYVALRENQKQAWMEQYLSNSEREARLAQNLRGDERVVVGDNAAGIDEFEPLPAVDGDAADTVTGDSGLIADDGTAASGDGIEQRGFTHVRSADDDDTRQTIGISHYFFRLAFAPEARRFGRFRAPAPKRGTMVWFEY
jgi:hypothetical protein